MNLYPPGHPPFVNRGLRGDDLIERYIEGKSREQSLDICLHEAVLFSVLSRTPLEDVRASLYRAEQLAETQPLPPLTETLIAMPQYFHAMLETLEATKKCLEEWLESPTCLAILAAQQATTE